MSMQIQRKKQKGQGMTEYIIIVALIALGAIAAFSFFGQSVRGQTAQMAEQVSGQNTNGAGVGTGDAQAASKNADNEAAQKVDLNNFKARGN